MGKLDKDLNRLLKRINKVKKPSVKEERRQTAKVKTHDVSADDPYLVGIMAKAEGRNPIKAIKKSEKKTKVTAAPAPRREIPMPVELSEIMAPPLPPMRNGKPNIVALVYAFRAFQQYSHAFTRRRLGDISAREQHYQLMKKRFRKAMKDANLDSLYDWSDL